MKVLVVEDDPVLRDGLVEILQGEGYETHAAADGVEGLLVFAREPFDFVCLDIMMPHKSGFDVCREIRRRNATVPLMFISAKGEEIDRVIGLELGADDFIVKPFGVREVVARIRAISRRALGQRDQGMPSSVRMRDLEIRPRELRAYRGDTAIDLSLRDVKVLLLLWQRRGEAVSREDFFNHVWGLEHVPNSRALDQQISQLRKRIERDAGAPEIIRTVHGVGYRFEEAE